MKIYKKNCFDRFSIPLYRRIYFYIILNVLIVLLILGVGFILPPQLPLPKILSIMIIILLLSLLTLITISAVLFYKKIKLHKGFYKKAKPFEKMIRKALIDTFNLNTVKQTSRIEVPEVLVDFSKLNKDKQIIVVLERLSNMDNVEKLVPLISNAFKGKKYGDFAVVDYIENDNKLDFTFILEDVKLDKTLIPKTIKDLLFKDLYVFKLQKGLNWDISKYPHLICSGATGSGKTTLLISLLFQCYKRKIETYLVDPKREFTALNSAISNTDEVLTLLEKLVEQMEERERELSLKVTKLGQTAKDLGYKPVMIFIDEVTALVAGFENNKEQKRFEQLVRQLVLKGRALGYNVLFFAQNFNSETLSVAIRNQPSIRIMLGQNSSEDYRFIFGSNTETIADGLVPRFTGHYLARGLTNTPQRFFVPNLHKYKLNIVENLKVDK